MSTFDSLNTFIRGAAVALFALVATGCANTPPPKYQPAVSNTEVLIKEPSKIAVGQFTATAGIENHQLSMRGANALKGGGADGTFSGYLHDAAISELQTAGRYDPHSDIVLTGILTRNELSTGMSTGTATIGAQFVLTRDGRMCFKKSFVAVSNWPSSFVGAIAIPNAISNYPTAYQKLLGDLFADSEFISALRTPVASR